MTVSTALATSFKAELLNGMHNFTQTVTPNATGASASTSLTAVSSTVGCTVGMTATGTNIAAGTVIAGTGTNALTLSKATTGAVSGPVTVSGDVFYIALIKVAPAGNWDANVTSYSSLGADEVTSGVGGYTGGGMPLVSNGAVLNAGVAIVDFQDVSWTSASFSCTGALIYNQSAKSAGVIGRAVSVHSIGDTTVSSGTLTLIFPVADSTHAIIRLS